MTDKKTIQEALAEVQRKVNEERMKQTIEMYKSLEEAMPEVTVGGKKMSTKAQPTRNKIDQYNVDAGRRNPIPSAGNQNLPGPPPKMPKTDNVTNIKDAPKVTTTSTPAPTTTSAKPTLATSSSPSTLQKVTGAAGKVLNKIAPPLQFGLDYAERKSAGQSTERALGGGAATTAGMMGGAALGSALGPIGSIAGGIAGAMGAGKAYDWAADKLSGPKPAETPKQPDAPKQEEPKPAETPKQETPPAGSAAAKMSFKQAYAKARDVAKEQGKDPNIAQFKWSKDGGSEKTYQAAATKADYVPMSKQFKVDIGSTPKTETPPDSVKVKTTTEPALPSTDTTKFTKPEYESGNLKKGKTKMSEEYDDVNEAMGKDQVGSVQTGRGPYPIYRKQSNPSTSFQDTYRSAKPGSTFNWQGRPYAKPGATSSAPSSTGISKKPAETQWRDPAKIDYSKNNLGKPETLPSIKRDSAADPARGVQRLPGGGEKGVGTAGGNIRLERPAATSTSTSSSTSNLEPTNKPRFSGAPDAKASDNVRNMLNQSPMPSSDRTPSSTTLQNPDQNITKSSSPAPMMTKAPMPTSLEYESGGKKKKMSEDTNPLIAAFLKLQSENPQNMFEAAKKAKKDYDDDGKIESPKDEVWGSRFRAAKAAGKMEEGNIDPVVTGSKSVTSSPKGYVDPSTPTQPYTKAPVSTAAGDVLDKAKNALDKTGVKEEVELDEISKEKLHKYISNSLNSISNKRFRQGHFAHSNFDGNKNNAIHDYDQAIENKKKGDQRQKSIELAAKKLSGMAKVAATEEVEFSQEEIDHINSFFLEASVAPARADVAIGADSTSGKVSTRDLTDETKEIDPRKHIQVEAGRAAAGAPVKFEHLNGKTTNITPGMGRSIIAHLNGLKPAERQAKVKSMHASPEGLKI